METKTITTHGKINGEEVIYTNDYPIPSTLAEAQEMLGEEACVSLIAQKYILAIHAFVRPKFEKYAELKEAERNSKITDDLESWKPGAGRPRVDKVEKLAKAFAGWNEDEQRRFLQGLKKGK